MSRLADGLGSRRGNAPRGPGEDCPEDSVGGWIWSGSSFANPDLLVLDEPTNHLDRSAKRWLMEELERFTGAVLLISHDLRLLDRAITKVLSLADGRLTEHPGNYTTFRSELLRRTGPARARRCSGGAPR